ncbi:hypothetical protein AVEN_273389-1 [Araneus ventricosus]|uniref:Uncharacterized protein n=1 Tax=Araneus ventricosus TaxID=182803 RepID=A0A4Y2K825_ARAVE|nr:hypothetical protein AVEN_273389-1 [Araneus ventricosus]
MQKSVSVTTHPDSKTTNGLSEREVDEELPVKIMLNTDADDSENSVVTEQKVMSKRGRKRKFGNLSREERKKRRNSNMSYVNIYNKVVEPKIFRDYICNCSRKCYQQVTIQNRIDCFESFWNTGDYNIQTILLWNMVKQHKVERRHRGNDKNRRSFSRVYTLNGVEVCRDFFCQTLRISTKRVNSAMKKQRVGESMDQRMNNGSHNRISDSQKQDVIKHIKKFPNFVSHYDKDITNSKYIAPDLTLVKMYQLYQSEHSNPVSFCKYQHIFLTNSIPEDKE